MDFSFLERSDGRGEYLWDQLLWVLATGAVVTLVGLVLALSHFTPEPHGNAATPVMPRH